MELPRLLGILMVVSVVMFVLVCFSLVCGLILHLVIG